MLHKLAKRFFAYSGKLYTWGSDPHYSRSTNLPKTSKDIPSEFQGFSAGEISKVAFGINHGAIITNDGLVYTFGKGNYGALGHDSEDAQDKPTLIESLKNIEIKVKDVAVGQHHTVLLTTEGDIWTMGYGGQLAGGIWRKMFSQGGGALGHGDLNDKFVPTPIEALKEHDDITQIAAGSYHSLALGSNGILTIWGKGEHGVLGLGTNRNHLSPVINRFFDEIKNEEKVKIKKIAACHYYTAVLLDDGRVFTWGRNDEGQLAIGSSLGLDMYECQRHPTEVESTLEGKKVIDVETGENIIVFKTEDQEVYVAGRKLWWEPMKLNTPPDAKITSIFAGDNFAGYINDERDVYFVGKIFSSKYVEEIKDLRIWKVKNEVFKGKLIEKIGGSYQTAHYCFLKDEDTKPNDKPAQQ
ncbi:unnamed protein product [Blepharisma stoltei]|uniref:RCC1-like domain-containing protein n=1 Tax=Blepharisma stoltei TaxID=1481888 RepID=A0AAU9II15_9CILI|nr:unnamed protein product [Blepharisma stoltei]